MQSKTIVAIAACATLCTGAKAQDKSSEKDVLMIRALKEKYPDWARYGVSYGNGCASGLNIHIGGRQDCCQTY